ncbi:DNA repair endonuclease XPF-like [Centruroides sculpturatus]|uniref:DNA repair endonuclease XPF-like n=1 Tax=Centruroides sculpturatus TaxID=218467 RepID=UPI000C6D6D83|nr:DNA repair endonuclease XPF-like [Centruroides sculpturatus]
MSGGVFFVTSRILVVDMLMDRVPIDLITGIIVYKAHKIIDSYQEAFILRLYRTKNKTGFIKALSSNPCAFARGFCQIQRVMRNLFVRKLYLWPRFHAVVSSTFEKCKPDVDELHITMTSAMQSIQLALLDIMNVCIKEIKKLNKTLDTEEVTVENAISKSFDKIIKYQLDPIWHQLGPKTHRLISDLKTLRTILMYLTQYDCVTFYNLLKSIRENIEVNAHMSDWLFMDVAENMFVQSKERLFGKIDIKKLKEERIEDLKLEDNPKWLVLSEILAEIKENTKKNVNPAVALILTDDDHTRQQINEFLCRGSQQFLRKLYNNSLKKKCLKMKSKENRKGGKKRKESELNEENILNNSSSSETDSEVEEVENEDKDNKTEEKNLTSPITIIQALHGSNDPFSLQKVLQANEPNYIILYNADIGAIRLIEMFQALNPHLSIKVYFLIYGDSAEEQRYLSTLRKEKEAFEFLIREKSVMAIPEDRDGKTDDHPDLIRNAAPANETVNPRKGGSQVKQTIVQQKIIVDLREFRSELPSLIHHRGIDIEPVTLEIGDYILTPDMCVERKSLSDLIGSLNSGRLYNQVKSMSRYYKKPVLLIEFDQNKSFSLQACYFLKFYILNKLKYL